MNQYRFDNILIGLITGLIAPIVSLFLYLTISFPQSNFNDQVNKFITRGVIAHVVSLSVIVNLLIFFIFIWTRKDLAARGVLGATILYALFIVFLKFAS